MLCVVVRRSSSYIGQNEDSCRLDLLLASAIDHRVFSVRLFGAPIQDACGGGSSIVDVVEYCNDGYEGPRE